jgi:hypothetical protein
MLTRNNDQELIDAIAKKVHCLPSLFVRDNNHIVEAVETLKSNNDCLLEAVQMVYRKHNLCDLDIGWEELGDKLLNTLCNVMGESSFNDWVNKEEQK